MQHPVSCEAFLNDRQVDESTNAELLVFSGGDAEVVFGHSFDVCCETRLHGLDHGADEASRSRARFGRVADVRNTLHLANIAPGRNERCEWSEITLSR